MTDEKPTDEQVDAQQPTDEKQAPGQAGRPAKRRPVARGTSLRRPDTEPAAPGVDPENAQPAKAEPAKPETEQAEPDSTMSEPTKAETEQAETEAAGPRTRADRTTYAIAAAAAIIGVLAILVAVVRPGAQATSNEAFVNTALTTQVTATAKQAAKDIYTIDMNDLGPWEQRLGGVLTPGMVDEAKKLRTAITQAAGALQDVKVSVQDADLTAGVSLANEDHAEVLLNVRQQVTAQGVPAATMQAPMKFVLDRFDGAWKVSSITQL